MKQYDIWLGIRLCAGAETSEEAERRAAEFATRALSVPDGRCEDQVVLVSQPVNLSEVAVRVLNEIGEAKSADATVESEGVFSPPHTS